MIDTTYHKAYSSGGGGGGRVVVMVMVCVCVCVGGGGCETYFKKSYVGKCLPMKSVKKFTYERCPRFSVDFHT